MFIVDFDELLKLAQKVTPTEWIACQPFVNEHNIFCIPIERRIDIINNIYPRIITFAKLEPKEAKKVSESLLTKRILSAIEDAKKYMEMHNGTHTGQKKTGTGQ